MSSNRAEEIADFFLHISETGLTHIKLQRLLYFAQAWRLANGEEPLFDEDFEAWSHGAHLPSIGHKYKDVGRIAEVIKPVEVLPIIKASIASYLEGVWRNYGGMSDGEIEAAALDNVWKSIRAKVAANRGATEVMPKEAISALYGDYL